MIPQLMEDDYLTLGVLGLWHATFIPEIQTNSDLISLLGEWWYSEHCTFHLPMGEMYVTLEDIYQILCIFIHGEMVV